MTRPVVVLGAAGHTGRHVVRALGALGVPMVLAGRRPEALAALAAAHGAQVRRAEIDDVASLRAMLEGAGALVSTVGPFLSLGLPAAAAAVDAGVPYVDTSAEQAFVQRVWEALDLPAQRGGITALPGHGADWAFSCLAAGVLRGVVGPLRRFDAFHDLGTFAPSPGTVRSMVAMMGEAPLGFAGGVWGPLRTGAGTVEVPGGRIVHTVPFPGGDVILLPREEVTLREASSNLVLSRHEALGVSLAQAAMGRVRPALRSWWLGPLAEAVAARVPTSDAAAPWTLWARAHGDGEAWVVITGPDTYANTGDVTAVLAAALARGEGRATGVRSAAWGVDAVAVLDALRGFGVRWQVVRCRGGGA